MPFVTFPEPPELKVSYENMIGDSKSINVNPWSVENPHPGFGKDPNILNELGHAKFPMWVDSMIEQKRVIVNNEMELAQHTDGSTVKPSVPQTNGWATAPVELKQDGPTLAEYMAAGYKASTYPPTGYASKTSDEEIKTAIAAEAPAWPTAKCQ